MKEKMSGLRIIVEEPIIDPLDVVFIMLKLHLLNCYQNILCKVVSRTQVTNINCL